MNTLAIARALPATLTVRVRPVYLPVGQFAERLCVAVVGMLPDGTAWARATTARPMPSLPKDLGDACHSFGRIVAEDFESWCARGTHGNDWHPPLTGLEIGEWIEVDGHDEDEAIRSATSLASLASPTGRMVAVDASLTTPRSSDEHRFLQSVKSEVTRTRPALAAGFGRVLSLRGQVSTGEVDFVGSRYVTSFAAINPKGRTVSRVQPAFAALWRLARTRDAFGFAAPPTIELTAWVPPEGLPIFSDSEYRVVRETVAELKEQAMKEQLDVFAVSSAADASRRLMEVESEGALLS